MVDGAKCPSLLLGWVGLLMLCVRLCMGGCSRAPPSVPPPCARLRPALGIVECHVNAETTALTHKRDCGNHVASTFP